MTYKCVIEGCSNGINLIDSVSNNFRYVCKDHPRREQISAVRKSDPVFDHTDSEARFQSHQFLPEQEFSPNRDNRKDPPDTRDGFQIVSAVDNDVVVPEWAQTDAGIANVIKTAFPKMDTNIQQRWRAGTWARMIYLYFKMRYTCIQIAEEMGLYSINCTICRKELMDDEICCGIVEKTYDILKVETTMYNIKNVSKGLNVQGKPRKKMGRPRKSGHIPNR